MASLDASSCPAILNALHIPCDSLVQAEYPEDYVQLNASMKAEFHDLHILRACLRNLAHPLKLNCRAFTEGQM